MVADYKLQMVPGKVLSPAPVLRHSIYCAHSQHFPKDIKAKNTLPVQRYMAMVSACSVKTKHYTYNPLGTNTIQLYISLHWK